jgi:hypothetical protein
MLCSMHLHLQTRACTCTHVLLSSRSLLDKLEMSVMLCYVGSERGKGRQTGTGYAAFYAVEWIVKWPVP